ncbi:MAG: RdgB/HAM1 family non-canonical purine NTP pyrophosphatase [Myxococcales bacterium]|nr:RdgB/HAM1 family non-canonical purine NTP pyrophosphatase [Myxococcales bacterium]
MKTLLLASANRGKIREFASLLRDVRVLGLADLGITDLDEPHDTFIENAIAKAREASRRSGLAALADDSGLRVDALGGAPGVYSARFSGVHGDDAANRRLLLAKLEGVPPEARGARFCCVLALADVAGPLGGAAVTAEGVAEGEIALEPSGEGGFGYDPLFVPRGHRESYASLDASVKHAISHRARAVAAMLPMLQRYLTLG